MANEPIYNYISDSIHIYECFIENKMSKKAPAAKTSSLCVRRFFYTLFPM